MTTTKRFKLFAKELNLSNPSLTIDSDKIYVNVVQGRAVSSETLVDALLKKNI